MVSKREGSIWVEGDYLHFVDDSSDEWRFLGDYVATPSGARTGSIWIETDYWHYIDSSGEERRMPGIYIQDHTSPATGARFGSVWLENTYHADGVLHNDTPHQDVTAYNHTDATYGSPSHTDNPNAFHQDNPHTDTSHVDGPSPSNTWTKPLLHFIEGVHPDNDKDERGAHIDVTLNQGHGDHTDSAAWHIDVAHGDAEENPGWPGHTDTSHSDSPVSYTHLTLPTNREV